MHHFGRVPDYTDKMLLVCPWDRSSEIPNSFLLLQPRKGDFAEAAGRRGSLYIANTVQPNGKGGSKSGYTRTHTAGRCTCRERPCNLSLTDAKAAVRLRPPFNAQYARAWPRHQLIHCAAAGRPHCPTELTLGANYSASESRPCKRRPRGATLECWDTPDLIGVETSPTGLMTERVTS